MPVRKREAQVSCAERKRQRAKIGSLTNNRVGCASSKRYSEMLAYFFWLLPMVSGTWADDWETRDQQVICFLEAMWCEGESRGRAGDLLSALQWHYRTRQKLPGSWAVFRTWAKLDPAAQTWPLPCTALFGMLGQAVTWGWSEMAALLYVGFHCFLRTGEMLSLSCSQVRGTRAAPVLCLPDTKTSKRHGETEYIAVEDEVAIVLLHWLVARRNGKGTFFTASPAAFRTMFRRLAEAVGLDSAAFTPYSIRRGGATHDYMSHGNLDRSLVRGRWQTGRTARLYIKVGEELLARPWCVGRAAQLEALRQVFLNFVQKVHHFSGG